MRGLMREGRREPVLYSTWRLEANGLAEGESRFFVATNNLTTRFSVRTIILVEISFDPAKSERNVTDRGLPFTLVEQLDWSDAIIEEDVRKNYGERRYLALGMIGDRLHAVVFTPRADKVHVISLRRANQREVNDYEQKTKP